MPKRISTARGREFGAGVRAAITSAGLTARAVAKILDWDEAKLSEVVNGKGAVNQLDVAALLGVCRVKSAEFAHLMSLYPETHVRGWWQQHGECAPIRLRTFSENMAIAESLTSWQMHTVPLFLQTAEYMGEVLRASSTVPAGELQDRVKAQLALQELLRGGKTCDFFIHELALRLPVGDVETYTGQLLHLLLMSNWTNITIRVVPAAMGAHAGLAGAFTRLTFAKYEPLVWVDTENSSLLIEEADAIKGYEKVIRALDAKSLDEVDSRDLIVRLYDAARPAEKEAATHRSVC
ncbi:helix-turn-helix domain-containing protein [Lentzea sp. NPDC059081]|uniref:helix-turn-helix domain-containing protein n=1 Tax=Lentzea sp. NPDC059081 TaxID=3346719 RepID=UPI0036A11CFD